MSDWGDWVARVTNGESSRQVGERIGHSHATALRWMSDQASPGQVIALAMAYDADVLEALVAAGWLMAEDMKNVNLDATLRGLSAVKLTRELYRRAITKEATGGIPIVSRQERL